METSTTKIIFHPNFEQKAPASFKRRRPQFLEFIFYTKGVRICVSSATLRFFFFVKWIAGDHCLCIITLCVFIPSGRIRPLRRARSCWCTPETPTPRSWTSTWRPSGRPRPPGRPARRPQVCQQLWFSRLRHRHVGVVFARIITLSGHVCTQSAVSRTFA